MTDSCDLLLRAAEMLDHTKFATPMKMSKPTRDDFAVPDISSGGDASPQYDYDESDMDADSVDTSDESRKRPRLAALKGAKSFLARDAIAHNSVEKRRRAYLASCYDGLRDAIPTLSRSRASNVKVLRGGAALIKALENEERRLIVEKRRLATQRDALIFKNNALTAQLVQRSSGTERAVPSMRGLSAPMPQFAMPRATIGSSDEAAMSLMMLAELCPTA